MEQVMSIETHTLWPTYVSVLRNQQSESLAAPLYVQVLNQFSETEKQRQFAYLDSDEGRCAEDLMLLAVNEHAKKCFGEEAREFRIEDCVDIWYYYLPKGTVDAGREMHNHPMSDFNAVYYINPDEADVEFYDPRWPNNNMWYTRKNKFLLKPKSGDIVVFEGHLWHQTVGRQLQSHRLCVVSNWMHPRPHVCAPQDKIQHADKSKTENVPYFNRLKNGLIKPSEYAKHCNHLQLPNVEL
jgi:hypothetical protein